jgi:hypothetical protein
LVNYLRGGRLDFPVFESENEKHLFIKELVFWELTEDAKHLQRLEDEKKPSPPRHDSQKINP